MIDFFLGDQVVINLKSVKKEHILQQCARIKIQDPAVLERTIHAFILLERLTLSKIDFLFKGGTALLLLLDKPARVSVDIDITCTLSKNEFEKELKEWIRHPPFTKWESDLRESDKEPPTRRHYKLYYNAQCGGFKNPYILLDVVEEECGIAEEHCMFKDIDCSFLLLEGELSKVKVPVVEALLGDKLTAFAPNTTGVRFYNPRLQEDSSHQVFKQLFDIAQLFDVMDNYGVVRDTYLSVVNHEAKYKAIKNIPDAVLLDTLQTAFDICTFDLRREKLPVEYEDNIRGGISKMTNDLINGKDFSIAEAKLAAGKAAYLATHILRKQDRLIPFTVTKEIIALLKNNRFKGKFGILDRLKGNIENYYYWYTILQMLEYPEDILN